jgi:hypothetical protein
VVWKCITDIPEPGNPASEWLGHELRFELSSAQEDPSAGWLANRLSSSDPDKTITILRFQDTGWTTNDRWYAFCNGAWGATLNHNLLRYCEGPPAQWPQLRQARGAPWPA